eukprot:jgi/Orpsp1_1/1185862/evm.model.c7180000095676.1
MRSYLKKISILALAAAANANLTKRDPYWIKMADVIQQVRPDFYFGVATQRTFFANPKYKDIMSTFNLQVGGNECKFYSINGSENFNTKPCDESVAFAKKFGAKFRGHNLFWPAYSPSWFKDAYDGKDIEETKEFILDYIAKVLDQYKDEEDILYWDVINESVTDDSTPTNIKLRTGSDTSNEFKGWDTYTEDIFTLAREHTNENVKLFYNDYNAEANNGNFEGKTGAVFNYIKSMREKGVPIDGVGLQMHVDCTWTPSYEDLTKLITQYEEIGVEVHITEIDVKLTKCNSVEDQKKVYMDAFKACFEHENCKVFTVWGSYDSESWVGAENEPLIFDTEMYPKDIYFDMLDYVMEKLPEDATYPTPTVTKPASKPTGESEIANVRWIVKPETYMIDPAWSSWSWGAEDVAIDDDGNVVATLEADKYGALSLHTDKAIGAGSLHLELKINKEGAPVKVIVHDSDDNQITLATLEDVSTEEFQSFDVEVEGSGYNRVSVQDAWGKAITITIHNFYYVPSDSASTGDDKPTGEKPTSEVNWLVKPESYMIDPAWSSWSWGAENIDFDDEGNVVVTFEADKYGAFSLHTNKKLIAGTVHVEIKSDVEGYPVKVLVHDNDDEQTFTYTIEDVSSEEFKAYDVEFPALEGTFYNRISVQDAWGKAITLTINNFYFTPAEAASTGDDKPADKPTEEPTEEPTPSPATPSDVNWLIKPGTSMFDPAWTSWSWGTDNIEFDEEGNAVATFVAEEYGALSLHTDKKFSAGTVHVELKSDVEGFPVKVLVHDQADEQTFSYTIEDVSSEEFKAYDVEVPALEDAYYDRISVQDAWGKAITLTISNLYFTPAPESNTEKPNPVETEGERYDIIKAGDGKIDSKWQNWSWGVEDTQFDEEGNFVNVLTPGEWGAISFKRGDSVKFGAGTLYFKAMVNDTKANLQVLFHYSDEDYTNMGSIKDISVEEMTQYSVEVTAPVADKYDRITIQDIYNKGVTLYLNDVYFVASPEKEPEVDPNCWAAALGFNCCKTTKTVVAVDDDGKWGVEDDFWCGIIEDKEETCWATSLGYPCCENSNVIYAVDESGSWGYEEDHWCGIEKANTECKFSALGYGCCPDNEVIFEDDHKWGANKNGQWCGVEF